MHENQSVSNFTPVSCKSFLFLSLMLAFQVANAQSSSSNQTLLEEKMTTIIDSLSGEHAWNPPTIAISFGEMDPERVAFLQTFLINDFSRRNITVNLDSAAGKFHIEDFSAQFSYHEPPGRLIGFNREIRRSLQLRLSGRLEDSQGRLVVASFSIKKSFNDAINSQSLAEIEKSQYSFMIGSLVSKSLWTRYLEPFVVISSVSVLIYLFFSMRT